MPEGLIKEQFQKIHYIVFSVKLSKSIYIKAYDLYILHIKMIVVEEFTRQTYQAMLLVIKYDLWWGNLKSKD